jgi:hypothetical protein
MQLERAWAGVDAGKEHHHVVVVDFEGRKLLSRRVSVFQRVGSIPTAKCHSAGRG